MDFNRTSAEQPRRKWYSMIAPFIMLLIALIPVIGMRDEALTVGVVSATLAVVLIIMAIALPVTSFGRFRRLLPPVFTLLLAAPALWMLVQVIPMPHALANPIWASTSAALNKRLSGVITIDIGATLLSLAQYCAVVAAALVTAGVTLDRQRAAQVLNILVVIATLIATRQIALEVTSFDGLSLASNGRGQASVVAVIGILLACAMAIDAIDQLRRSDRLQRSRTKAVVTLSVAILSFLICTAATLIRANPAVAITTLFSAGMLFAVFAIRRWLLGPWGAAGLAAAAAVGMLSAFGAIPVQKDAQLVTALSTQTQAATERMLSDVAPAGSGAGAFEARLPIYRDISTAAMQEHPTAAALIMIEMGPAFLTGLVIAALFGAWTLFNRSLSRGHDYVYAAAGASALISLPIMAFVDGGILNFGASLMIGVLCGLAFAQSLSGTPARDVMSLDLQDSSDEADREERKTRPVPSPSFDRTWPRIALAIFGLLLTVQASWILLTETDSPDGIGSSMEQNAIASGVRRKEIWNAASIAVVRGDLWAESGFASVAQPWTDPGAALDPDDFPGPALNAFTRALHYSPHRGDVWLMLAALASRYKPGGYDTAALLKMSYYTAPNEWHLLPLRLHVALGVDMSEPELREMVKRDISIVLSRLPALKPALVAAYRSASPSGKIIAESLISELDPGYLRTIRTQYP
jgi:hypothetical protein